MDAALRDAVAEPTAASSFHDLLRRFAAPPSENRPQIFMVWNGTVTRSYIAQALREFKDAGVGGVWIHPRPGLITEYLSEEWFALWNFAAEEAARLGLLCHIYDENSFPAGFAGGHVPARDPLTVAQWLVARWHRVAPVRADGERVATFRSDAATGRLTPLEASQADQAVAEGPVLTLSLVRDSGALWQGGFPYVDLTHPRTTRAFIETTYRAYADSVRPHFGTTCRWAFSDEPMLRARGGWPMSRYLLAEFRREHGYDLLQHLDGLLAADDAARAVRFDYQMTVQRLLEENFARPMAQTCRELGLAWTGHFMEHEWPSPRSHPSAMSLLRYMHTPGNDLLAFQFDPSRPPRDNAIWLLNLAELRSVARQTGATRTMCETCGGGGYAYAPRDLKACEDFALAGGVNLVVPHLSHQTLTGARRYDWGQTISPHAPWFEAYRQQADHVARVQTALLAGKPDARVLLLMPTTTAWLHDVPAEAGPSDSVAQLAAIRQSQCDLVHELVLHLIDFDLGDELVLRDLGDVRDGRLVVGDATYDVVVVPPGMDNVLPSTLDLLHRLAPGRVLSLRDPPNFVSGRRADVAASLRWAAHDVPRFNSTAELVAALRTCCPPDVETPGGKLPDTVLHLSRRLDVAVRNGSHAADLAAGGRVHFFANPYPVPATLELDFHAQRLFELDTATGQLIPTDSASSPEPTRAGVLRWSRLLPPRGHALVLTSRAPAAAGLQPEVTSMPDRPPSVATGPTLPPRRDAPTWSPIAAGPVKLKRTAPNLLVLDYCDLSTLAGTHLTSVPCIRADAAVWHDHGMEQNPWRWAIQYRRTYLETPFPRPSGFTLSFRFTLEPGVDLSTIELAVERPHLYDIALNGQPVDLANGTLWFDEETRRGPAGHAARYGDNVLTLTARSMHPLCEVVPAYVLGDFAVRQADVGFRLSPPARLQPGDLVPQGLPFLDRGVEAEVPVRLSSPVKRLRVELSEWSGSAIGVSVASERLVGPVASPSRPSTPPRSDEVLSAPSTASRFSPPPAPRPVGWIIDSPGVVELDGPFAAGQLMLRLDLRGVLQNRLGPWHREGLPIPWTWEAAPSPQPSGAAYRLRSWGLGDLRVFVAM